MEMEENQKPSKDQQLCFNGPKVAFVLHAVHTRKSTLNVFISAEYFSYFLKQVAVRGKKKEIFSFVVQAYF